MTNAEAVNWLINITADIGKAEHSDLWHYEQALSEIREMLEDAQSRHYHEENLLTYAHDMGVTLEQAKKELQKVTEQPETHDKRTETHACDLIARRAAIDALDGVKVDEENCTEYDIGYNDGIDFAVSRLSVLPSAQPERWIPCSERLPEDEQPILFSTTTGRVHQGRFHRDNSVNRWYSSLDKMRAYNNVVNAWMPLPEPYKEDDHD